MISTIISIILLLLFSGSLYVIFNLLKKVEIYEEDIQYKDEYIRQISQFITEQDKKLQDETIRRAFESDDQVGDFFKGMKGLVLGLQAYQQNYTEQAS